jgi:outer membrane cobalamin receptor
VEKQQPESRKIDVEPKTVADQSTRPLPKIDLPEFVITGVSSIDLPNAEKLSPDEPNASPHPNAGLTVERDRPTDLTKNGFLGTPDDGLRVGIRGKASASIGTFSAPTVGFSWGNSDAQVRYSFEGGYHRTKGFGLNTDRSEGSLGAAGGFTFRSSLAPLDRAAVGAEVGYANESYKWYGSAKPTNTRDHSQFAFLTSLASSQDLNSPYDAQLKFEQNTLTDTSSRTAENRIDFGLRALFPVSPVSLKLDMKTSVASLSGASSSSLSLVEFGAGIDQIQWNEFTLEGSIRLYSAQGMEGQSLSKVYPAFHLGYRIGEEQRIFAYYNPGVEFRAFGSEIVRNPYLSASSVVRHADTRFAGGAGWESHWSQSFHTRLKTEFQSGYDEPLYADSSGVGVWNLAYGGKSSRFIFKAELFANLSPNDYFGSALTINSTNNSATQKALPYVPEVEGSFVYNRTLSSDLTLSAGLSFFHTRMDNAFNGRDLAGSLILDAGTEYRIQSQLKVFLEIHNLTSQRYELWKGYQAMPFTVALGVHVLW